MDSKLENYLIEGIAHILTNELNYAYCDNCNNRDKEEKCDGCYRKYQNWCLGEDTASDLAKKIMLYCEKYI